MAVCIYTYVICNSNARQCLQQNVDQVSSFYAEARCNTFIVMVAHLKEKKMCYHSMPLKMAINTYHPIRRISRRFLIIPRINGILKISSGTINIHVANQLEIEWNVWPIGYSISVKTKCVRK